MPVQSKKRKHRPIMPWQVEEYARLQELSFFMPYNLLLLCRITGTTPRSLIISFLHSLEGYNLYENSPPECQGIAEDYFIKKGYGSDHYSEAEIRQMFKEMHALQLLFPHHPSASDELTQQYCKWRELHHTNWFNKWFYTNQRKL